MFLSYINRQLICYANQLTGFYMMGKFVVKRLNKYCISKNIANHNKEKIH